MSRLTFADEEDVQAPTEDRGREYAQTRFLEQNRFIANQAIILPQEEIPEPPNEIRDRGDLDILNHSEVRKTLADRALEGRVSFNQYIDQLQQTAPQITGMQQGLSPEASRAAMESDSFFRACMEYERNIEGSTRSGSEPEHLDQETIDIITSPDVAGELIPELQNNNYREVESILRNHLSDEQVERVLNSTFLIMHNLNNNRKHTATVEDEHARAVEENNQDEIDRLGRQLLELYDREYDLRQALGQELGNRQDWIAGRYATGTNDSLKRLDHEGGGNATQQDIAAVYGEDIAENGERIGVNSEAIRNALHEELGVPEDLLGSSMEEYDAVDEEAISSMPIEEVTRMLLLYKRISELQRKAEERERRRGGDYERRSTPEQDEERAATNRRLRERLKEITEGSSDEILERIEDGRISFYDGPTPGNPQRAPFPADQLSETVPVRIVHDGIADQDNILQQYMA
jgi:hypothetical protein